MNRRDLFKLFGAGATVVALENGTPLLAEPARLIEPAKVEPVAAMPFSGRFDDLYEIVVFKRDRPDCCVHIPAATFDILASQPEVKQLVGQYGYPTDVAAFRANPTIRWAASGTLMQRDGPLFRELVGHLGDSGFLWKHCHDRR